MYVCTAKNSLSRPIHSEPQRTRGDAKTLGFRTSLLGVEPAILAEDLGEPVAALRARLGVGVERDGDTGASLGVAGLKLGSQREEPIPEVALGGREGHGGIVAGVNGAEPPNGGAGDSSARGRAVADRFLGRVRAERLQPLGVGIPSRRAEAAEVPSPIP